MDEKLNGENEFGPDYVTITDEDGVEYDFEVLGTVEEDGGDYIALCEADTPEDTEAIEIVLMRVIRNEDDTVDFESIDDEEEEDRVWAAFLDEVDADEDTDD